MSNIDFDANNIIAVSEANLRDEQKQAMAKAIEEYKQLCFKSFSLNRSGEVIQKEALPMPRQITFEANRGKLQEMVDSAINHALINQSSVLSNTVFNAMARTFKEGQIPPSYVGPAYHQPGSSSVTTPSAPPAVEVTSPPSMLGITNGQSTPMRTTPATSEGQVQLATDLLASAMLGSVIQNCQVPPNWWGYGMPLDFGVNSSGMSQVADVIGKAPMTSAPPISPMTQNPQYSTTTTARLFIGNSQMLTFQIPNASVDPLPTHQRFMTQAGYVNPMMTPNYQPSAGPTPMNVNNVWTGHFVFPQMAEQNHQGTGQI